VGWDIHVQSRGGGGVVASTGGGQVEFDHYSTAEGSAGAGGAGSSAANGGGGNGGVAKPCIALRARALFQELGVDAMEAADGQPPSSTSSSPRHADVSAVLSRYLDGATDVYHRTEEDCRYVPVERFERVTKELCNLPTFFHKPLYARILALWEGRIRRRRSSRRWLSR